MHYMNDFEDDDFCDDDADDILASDPEEGAE